MPGGIELTVCATLKFFFCGICVANPLHTSGVDLTRVGADKDSVRSWDAVLETCTLATFSLRRFALSALEDEV